MIPSTSRGPRRGAPSVEGWHVDGRGRLWVADAEGRAALHRDGDGAVDRVATWWTWTRANVRALVRVAVAGGVRERALVRDVLLNQSRIISALGPLGANISSTNAKDVVTVSHRLRAQGSDGERPRARSVTHLGVGGGAALSSFMPYNAGGEVRFDPSPDEAVKARPFMEASGTLEEWVAGVAPARGGVAGVPLRAGGELRLAPGGPSRRADVHRVPVGKIEKRQDADPESGGLGLGRPDRGLGLLLPHVRGHAEVDRAGGGAAARHPGNRRRAAEQGRAPEGRPPSARSWRTCSTRSRSGTSAGPSTPTAR